MAFAEDFDEAFYRPPRFVTVDPGQPTRKLSQAERPQHPPYSRLWRHYRYPCTPAGLLLWKDGTVKEVDTFYDEDFLTCDDNIFGGRVWCTPEGSWQAQVLADAGYTLTDYEGPTP